MQDRVNRLIDARANLTSAFQPIVSLRGDRPLGYEALLRLPPDAPFAGPAEAFDAAAGTPLLVDLELAALEAHLGAVVGRFPRGLLFLNVSAQALLDPRLRADALRSRVRSVGIHPERVVLEITELVRVPDPTAFARALTPLRAAGFRLAIDDFGAGFSNMRILVELGPDYLKVDRSLVSGAAEHARKRVFLESLAVLGPRINCAVIGEGVETAEDLAALRACGIPFAQGFGLARPADLSSPDEEVRPSWHTPPVEVSDEQSAGALAIPQEAVAPELPVGQLVALFDSPREPPAIPVVRLGRALGLVTRHLLFSHLGHRYGFALWSERSVATFIAANAAGSDRLPASASLEEAAELVRRRPAGRRFDPVVIETENGGYHGLLTVDLLLSEMTRLKVEYALQANPLTGLPGSLALARAAEGRLASGQPFALAWVDVDHFKSYNDRYGFQRGDDVLLLLARLLKDQLGGRPDALLAHPGGDDFAFLASPDGAEETALRIAHEFDQRVPGLYDPADRAAGGIVNVDRRGDLRSFGFVSVSIGLVTWRAEPGIDYRRLVEIAAEVKSKAKRIAGAAVVVNARSLSLPSDAEMAGLSAPFPAAACGPPVSP